VVNFLLALRYEQIVVKIALFERGWVILSTNFSGNGTSTNKFWRQKTRVPGLSRGLVCVILRLAVLIQYRRVTHTQTGTQTQRHAIMVITRTELAPRR